MFLWLPWQQRSSLIFYCYSRILLSYKIWSGYVYDALSYRGKEFILDTAVVTSFGHHFHSESDCHDVFLAEKSVTLQLDKAFTNYQWSTAFVSFSWDLLSQIDFFFGWTVSLIQFWVVFLEILAIPIFNFSVYKQEDYHLNSRTHLTLKKLIQNNHLSKFMFINKNQHWIS